MENTMEEFMEEFLHKFPGVFVNSYRTPWKDFLKKNIGGIFERVHRLSKAHHAKISVKLLRGISKGLPGGNSRRIPLKIKKG